MKIEHNKIIAHYGEHISVLYPVHGTLLSGYNRIVCNLRGKSFFSDFDLETDEYDNTIRLVITEELNPGRYYYEIVGTTKTGSRVTLTKKPLCLEVLPSLDKILENKESI